MSASKKLEDYPVGFLHVLRQFQDQPYEVISSRKMCTALAQQNHFKVPAHVAKRTLVDFYTLVNGHYGIQINDVRSVQSLTLKRKRSPPAPPAGYRTANTSLDHSDSSSVNPQPASSSSSSPLEETMKASIHPAAGLVPQSVSTPSAVPLTTTSSGGGLLPKPTSTVVTSEEGNISNNVDSGLLQIPVSVLPAPMGVPSPATTVMTNNGSGIISSSGPFSSPSIPQQQPPQIINSTTDAQLEMYRLQAIKQNQKTNYGPKVCSYYFTKEGCRRGANCPWVHPAQ